MIQRLHFATALLLYFRNIGYKRNRNYFIVYILPLVFHSSAISQSEFITTWKTDHPGSSCSSCITIPTEGFGYYYDVDWNNDGRFDSYGVNKAITHFFGTPGIYTIRIRGNFRRIYFDNSGDSKKIISIDQWGKANWSTMENAFWGASNLTINASDAPILSRVKNMVNMFSGATSLNSNLGNWNITNVSDMTSMLDQTGLSITNYDKTLKGWAAQNVKTGVALGASGLAYCNSVEQRNALINDKGWAISGDSEESCSFTYFVTTWKSDNPGTSCDNCISIPTMGNGYNYYVDWDNNGVFEEVGITGDVTHDYGSPDNYTIQIRGDFPRIYFNESGDHQKILSIDQWGEIEWQSMENAFLGVYNLVSNASDIPNLSMVADMSSMFELCFNFSADLNNWDVSHVNDMSFMFFNAQSFNGVIGNWDVSNVTSMFTMFKDAVSYNQDIGGWDVSRVDSMQNMLDLSGISFTIYDNLLTGWSSQAVQSGVVLGAQGLSYCNTSLERSALINDAGWTIIGDALNCMPLPVELISFHGRALDDVNQLEWQTATELNTEFHIIERSHDGSLWNKIGEIDAAGNSLRVLSYIYTDELPPALAYYRLKTLDFDGSFQFSDMINLSNEIDRLTLRMIKHSR